MTSSTTTGQPRPTHSFPLWDRRFDPHRTIIDPQQTAAHQTDEQEAKVSRPIRPRRKRKEDPSRTAEAGKQTKPKSNKAKDNRPSLNLVNPQKKLRSAYQAHILHSLDPQEDSITDGTEKINFESAAIVGCSGSGLTTMLSYRALENFRNSKPTIILSDHDHIRQKIAQNIIDFANPEERNHLAQNIEVINDFEQLQFAEDPHKIYILSTQMLEKFDYDNQNFPVLQNIQEILVDDVHSYTGKPSDGRTKLLLSLLKHTKSSSQRPTTLIGVSSTPYQRDEDPDTLQFNTLFDPSAVETTPNYKRLSELGFLRRIISKQIHVQGSTSTGEPLATSLLGSLWNSILLDSQKGSVNDQIITELSKEYKPKKKFHIIANSTEHANILCKILAKNLPEANPKILTDDHHGFYQTKAGNDDLEFHKENKNYILQSYENGGCDILIDIGLSQGFNSGNTDVCVVLERNSKTHNLMRYIGEASQGANGTKTPLEFWFLDPKTLKEFNKQRSDSFPEFGKVAKSRSLASTSNAPIEVETNRATLGLHKINELEFHPLWYEKFLRAFLATQTLDEYANELYTKVQLEPGESKPELEEIKKIILGNLINTKIFRQFLELNNPGLGTGFTEKVIATVPELTGIENPREAENVVFNCHKEGLDINKTYGTKENNNIKWLEYLDRGLFISDYAVPKERIRLRSIAFAKVLYDKFGPNCFTNKEFITKAISVFTGNTIDHKLFALIVNGLGLDFEEVRTNFSHLSGNIKSIPFKQLKELLQKKYSHNSIDMENLDGFFQKQIFADLGIDFATLVHSLTEYSNHFEPDQKIIDGSLREKIHDFLNAHNQALGQKDLGQSFRADIDSSKRARLTLNSLEKEILYNQILAKVWNIKRSSILVTDDFVYGSHADEVYIEHNFLRLTFPESQINLVESNLDWVGFIDNQLQSRAEFGKANIDTKKRLAHSIQEFIKNQRGEVVPEASSTKSNPFTLSNNQVLNIEDHRSILGTNIILKSTEPEPEKRLARLISGGISPHEITAEDQQQLREYVKFIGLEPEEILWKFPKLLGVTKEKLISKIRDIRSCSNERSQRKDLLNALSYQYQSPNNLNQYVAKLAKDLGLSPDDMYRITEVPNPNVFYKEPIRLKLTSSNSNFSEDIADLDETHTIEIQQREFLRAIWGEKKYLSYTNINEKTSKTKIKGNEIGFEGYDKPLKEITESEVPEHLKFCKVYRFENGAWKEDTSQAISLIQPALPTASVPVVATQVPSLNIRSSMSINPSWSADLSAACEGDLDKLGALIAQFLVEPPRQNLDPRSRLEISKILFGDKSKLTSPPLTKEERNRNQDLFRQFVNFVFIKTNCSALALSTVIANHPQLTGLRNLDELKDATRKLYPDQRSVMERIDKKNNIKFYEDFNLDIDDLSRMPILSTIQDKFRKIFRRISKDLDVNIPKDLPEGRDLIALINCFTSNYICSDYGLEFNKQPLRSFSSKIITGPNTSNELLMEIALFKDFITCDLISYEGRMKESPVTSYDFAYHRFDPKTSNLLSNTVLQNTSLFVRSHFIEIISSLNSKKLDLIEAYHKFVKDSDAYKLNLNLLIAEFIDQYSEFKDQISKFTGEAHKIGIIYNIVDAIVGLNDYIPYEGRLPNEKVLNDFLTFADTRYPGIKAAAEASLRTAI